MSRALRTVQYASRTTGVDFEKWLTWAAIGGVAYLLYKTISTVRAAGEVLTNTGSAIGEKVFDLFNKAYEPGTSYTVRFPDGKNHAVPANVVSQTGEFVNRNLAPTYPGDGKRYRIMIDSSVKSGVNKRAVLI